MFYKIDALDIINETSFDKVLNAALSHAGKHDVQPPAQSTSLPEKLQFLKEIGIDIQYQTFPFPEEGRLVWNKTDNGFIVSAYEADLTLNCITLIPFCKQAAEKYLPSKTYLYEGYGQSYPEFFAEVIQAGGNIHDVGDFFEDDEAMYAYRTDVWEEASAPLSGYNTQDIDDLHAVWIEDRDDIDEVVYDRCADSAEQRMFKGLTIPVRLRGDELERSVSYYDEIAGVLDLLNICPQEFKKEAEKYWDCYGRWPRKRKKGEALVTPKELIQEMLNAFYSSYITILAGVDAYEYLCYFNNPNRYTITIPKGSVVGIFCSWNGSGSLFNATTNHDTPLGDWEIVLDNGNGYSVRDVYGQNKYETNLEITKKSVK